MLIHTIVIILFLCFIASKMFKMNHYSYTHMKQKYDFTALKDKKNIFPQLKNK